MPHAHAAGPNSLFTPHSGHWTACGLSLELHRAKLEPHLLRYPLFQWLNAGTDRIQIMRRICNDAVKLEIYAPLEFVS